MNDRIVLNAELDRINDPKLKRKVERACLTLIAFIKNDRHGNITFSAKDGILADKVKKEIYANIE